MRAPRSAVLIELDPPAARRTWRAAGLTVAGICVALGIYTAVRGVTAERAPVGAPAPVAAAATAAATAAPRGAWMLTLPLDVADVELIAFPDWLANEPPPSRMRATVRVRGTVGLASVDLPATINWTEDGVSYHLTSARHSVSELIGVAARLRVTRR